MDNLAYRDSQTNEFQTLFKLAQRQTKADETSKMYADVLPCVRLLSLSGIFPLGCQKKKKRLFICSDLQRKLVEAFLHTYWVYVFFISFLSAVRMSRQFKTNFTLSLGNALVACIRFSVHWKARRLPHVVRSIEAFHSSLAGEGRGSVKGCVTALCCGGTLAAIGLSVLTVEYLKMSGSFDSFSQDFILGVSFPNSSCPFLLHFPPAVFVSTIFFHHFVPVTVCIYACVVFHLLGRAVAEFTRGVRRDAASDVGLCAARFGRMMELVSDVEDLLGTALFFSFGCLLTNQLCVMNSAIVGDRLPIHPVSIAMESMLSLKNFVVFFAITVQGASVSEGIEDARSEIGRLAVDPPSGVDGGRLSLLLQVASSSRTSLTVWKVFSLRRNLFLTTASVLTTYGMLLMQLSQQDRPNVFSSDDELRRKDED